MFQYCESINSFIHAYLQFNKETKHAVAELSETKVFTDCVKSNIKDQNQELNLIYIYILRLLKVLG